MKKVFLGVGHGGRDPGAVSNGFMEKDLNLDIALSCRAELERHGIVVLMSRVKDEDDVIGDEIREANAFMPDIAVDIHNNAGGGDGFEGFYQIGNAPSKLLVENVEREVLSIGQNSRGVKTRVRSDGLDYFGFLRQINAVSILCEFAFMDNPRDIMILDTSEKRASMGVALAKGILRYIGIIWTKPDLPVLPEWYIWVGRFESEEKAMRYAAMIGELPGKPYQEVRMV